MVLCNIFKRWCYHTLYWLSTECCTKLRSPYLSFMTKLVVRYLNAIKNNTSYRIKLYHDHCKTITCWNFCIFNSMYQKKQNDVVSLQHIRNADYLGYFHIKVFSLCTTVSTSFSSNGELVANIPIM